MTIIPERGYCFEHDNPVNLRLKVICGICGKEIFQCPQLTQEQCEKMKRCGNCDSDQENLCDDCPARISEPQLLALGFGKPEKRFTESKPQEQESKTELARRLLSC